MGLKFLNWVISPDFTKLSYTNPASNEIIKIGLNFTQSLVNMALLLVLIYAALSIALKLTQEAAAKKMLALFVLVALLVNFAPVLCGLFVDAANIIMKLFTEKLQNVMFTNFFEAIKSAIDTLGETIGWDENEPSLKEFGIATLLIIFNSLLATVLFIFGGLLVLRHLAIWVLVILAPLAFVCIILPQTQQYWKLWRDQFLKWAFIGVPVAFFLYLAAYLSANIRPHLSTPQSKFGGAVDELLIYGIPLVFLYLALRLSTKSTAWGVAAAVGFGSAFLKRGLKLGREKVLPWTKETIKESGRRYLAPGVEPIAQRLERIRIPLLGRTIGAPGAALRRREARYAELRKEMEAIPDIPEGNEALTKIVSRRALSLSDREKRIAAIETLAKRKELKDEVAQYLSQFQQLGGDISTVYKARPDFAPHFTDPTTGKAMKIEQVMKKIEPGEFWRTVQKEALRNADVVIHAAKDERKFVQTTRHLKPGLKQEFKNTLLNPEAKPSRPLTSEEIAIISKRIKQVSTQPEWQV